MVKRRGIAKKPIDKTADDWVGSGGVDPEISTANQVAQTKSKSEKALPKSRDPNFAQIGLYLPKKLHKRLKVGAAVAELEISDIAAQAIDEWLERKGIGK